jgi:hypothetical protein
MKDIINLLTVSTGAIFLISLFAMSDYLYRKKIYTWWQLRFNFMWPRIIFEYRDHTKKYSGKEGIWYNISKVSFIILVITFIATILPHIYSLPTPILIVIAIFVVTIVPALGYAIYGLSKEKYF